MHSSSSLLLALLVVAAALGGAQGRQLLQLAPGAEAEGRRMLRVGMWRGLPSPLKEFDNAVRQRIDELAGMQSEVVLLNSLDARVNALANDTVDWVIGGFTVTPERAKLVDFVLPYYYGAGATLFAPGGQLQGVNGWEDLKGKKVVTFVGYFANNVLERNYGADLVFASDPVDGAQRVLKGEGVALVTDSTELNPDPNGQLKLVPSVPILLPSPYGVAVRKGNTELAGRISRALRQMATGGQQSDLARFEQQYLIPAGASPNPDLAALLADPESKTTSLNSDRSLVG